MKQQGFTLIELATSITIILIISSIGMGGLRGLLRQSQANSDIAELLLQVRSTRQYAITYSQHAVLCPSHNLKDCINDWKAPKMIFLDSNNNNKRDANETIERQFHAVLDSNIMIKYPKTQIRFNNQGVANFYNGTLAYCSEDIVYGLVISRLGRIRVAQDLDGDHNPDVNSSTTVKCS
jgi:type IV fimbrial biogenesis protein FimT